MKKTGYSFKIIYFILTSILAICFFNQEAVARHYYFKKMDVAEGLPSTIKCSIIDKDGFLWIGSPRGLGKYDGTKLIVLQNSNNDYNVLPSDNITNIIEDKKGNIWILTTKGLVLFDKSKNEFKELGLIALSISENQKGLFIGGKNAIYHYNYDSKKFRKAYSITSIENFNVNVLVSLDDNSFLCANKWKGILHIDTISGKTTPVFAECGKKIQTIITDSNQHIWIAPYNLGVKEYDNKGNLIAEYNKENSSLSNNIILSMVEKDEEIWLGTDGGGINILNPKTKTINTLKHIPSRKWSFPANSIINLYKDKYNNIWAGSVRNGLINIRETSMMTYSSGSQNNPSTLSDETVLCLYKEDKNKIWIGTDGGGINLFNPEKQHFTHFKKTYGDKISSICTFKDKTLLLSIFSKGLYIFNPKNGFKKPFIIFDKYTNDFLCKNGKSVNLYKCNTNEILILTEHIYKYNLNTGKFKVLLETENIQGTPQFIDKKNGIIYIHDFRRIYSYNPSIGERLETIFTCPKEISLNSVTIDKQNNFYLGTNKGLYYLNNALKLINLDHEEDVSLVVCDNKNNIWFGSKDRLMSWNSKDKLLCLYGESDGALRNEYISKARLVEENGTVFMGGVRGLLRINTNVEKTVTEAPQLHISSLSSNGKPIKIEKQIKAKLGSKIDLTIISNEENFFRRRLYNFYVSGPLNMNISSELPFFGFEFTKPGTYYISATCNMQNGRFTLPQNLLIIEIPTPWFQSWWFIILCILATLLVIASILQRIWAYRDKRMNDIISKHKEQLSQEKKNFLINISHELRTPLTIMYAHLSKFMQEKENKELLLQNETLSINTVEAIYRQEERMRNLVNMVLDVCKIESGANKITILPYDINIWLKEIINKFESEAEAKNIKIIFEPNKEISLLSFDATKCEVIMSNLLINAFKQSHSGSSIVIKVLKVQKIQKKAKEQKVQREKKVQKIEKETKEQKLNNTNSQYVRISISDQGQGNAAELGVGLSYSKILAKMHGGEIGYKYNTTESENPTEGNTHYLDIPLRNHTEELTYNINKENIQLNDIMTEILAENTSIKKYSSNFDTSTYTILLVDDNKDLTDFFKKSLEEHFKKVLIASDGEEGLKIAIRETPDIIVSDVMMPRMNGYELCKSIKEDLNISHIPVILLTARDDKESIMSGYKTGADGYITKPFEMDMLIELIRNRLVKRENIRKQFMSAGFAATPEDTTFSNTDENFLLKLNKIINDNISDPKLDVAYVCSQIGMSNSSLYNKLKVLTGMSFVNYLKKIRMEKAKEIICSTDLPITEIADMTGYSTSRYFSSVFKQYTGLTPSDFKKNKK